MCLGMSHEEHFASGAFRAGGLRRSRTNEKASRQYRRLAPKDSRHSLRNGEYPDNAALRHVLLPPDQLTHEPLLEGGVDTPARLYRDVLDAIDLEGRGRRDDT